MRKFDDLIYYKQDVIDAYAEKRKTLDKRDVEDLLKCALLFLEKEMKNKKKEFTSFEIPNIGFLHKKLDLDNLGKITKVIKKEDDFIAECAYIDTRFLPITLRKDMLATNYPNLSIQEIQQIQNNK